MANYKNFNEFINDTDYIVTKFLPTLIRNCSQEQHIGVANNSTAGVGIVQNTTHSFIKQMLHLLTTTAQNYTLAIDTSYNKSIAAVEQDLGYEAVTRTNRDSFVLSIVDKDRLPVIKRTITLINSDNYTKFKTNLYIEDDTAKALAQSLYNANVYAVRLNPNVEVYGEQINKLLIFVETIPAQLNNLANLLQLLLYYAHNAPETVKTYVLDLFTELCNAENINEKLEELFNRFKNNKFFLKESCVRAWRRNQTDLRVQINDQKLKVKNLEESIEDYKEGIKNFEESIKIKEQKIEELTQELNTLIEEGPDYSTIQELEDNTKNAQAYIEKYFPNIKMQVDFGKQEIHLDNLTTLEHWDVDKVDSCLQRIAEQDTSERGIAILWHTLTQGKYLIPTYTECTLNLLNNNASKKEYATYKDGYMPQPHLMRFNCWGSHEQAIADFLKNRDIEGAIVQINYACKQLNLSDNYVISTMTRILQEYDYMLYNTETEQYVKIPDVLPEIIEEFEKTDLHAKYYKH